MYNTRVEETRASGNSRSGGHRWGFMKTEFVLRWRNRRELLLEFLLHRTAYRRMLRGYANAAHMSTGTFSTIYIVPRTAGSPIVCHTNLTCHRFQLLSGGFRSETGTGRSRRRRGKLGRGFLLNECEMIIDHNIHDNSIILFMCF